LIILLFQKLKIIFLGLKALTKKEKIKINKIKKKLNIDKVLRDVNK